MSLESIRECCAKGITKVDLRFQRLRATQPNDYICVVTLSLCNRTSKSLRFAICLAVISFRHAAPIQFVKKRQVRYKGTRSGGGWRRYSDTDGGSPPFRSSSRSWKSLNRQRPIVVVDPCAQRSVPWCVCPRVSSWVSKTEIRNISVR